MAERDEHTPATWRSQARKWIYPKIGTAKLKDFTATGAGKRSLTMIKSTLRRSIRRAQIHSLIARNAVELIGLPAGQRLTPSGRAAVRSDRLPG